MRVVIWHSRSVAHHKGIYTPGRDTYTRRKCIKCSSMQHLRSQVKVHGSLVLSAFTTLLGNWNMALQSPSFSVILPQFMVAHALVLREVMVAHCIGSCSGSDGDCGGSEVVRGYSFNLSNSGMYVILPQSGIRIGCSAVVWAHSLVPKEAVREYTCYPPNSRMQRERQRGISRRGSYRGRASIQRQAPSPSSSIEVSSERRRSRGRAGGRGRVVEHQERMECGHSEHPMVRYRIPCTLSNSTFFVTVSVEHCRKPRGQDEALHASPPWIPRLAPSVDMQLPTVDMLRPVQDSFSPDPGADPSEPVQRNIPTEPDIHQPPRCKTEDDPHTTDDD